MLLYILIIIFFVIYFFQERKECFKVSIYGDSPPKNKLTPILNILLKHWSFLTRKLNINWTLAYGSLLGHERNKDYIPYDTDLDVLIDPSAIPKLLGLLNGYSCFYQTDTIKLKGLNPNKIYLIINKWHNISLKDRHYRVNCQGKLVDNQEDDCSFVGPFARLIYRHTHLDIDLYCRYQSRYRDLGYQDGHYFSWFPSRLAEPLPPTKRSTLHGIPVLVLKYPKFFLTNYYGKNYLKPNKIWKNKHWHNNE